MAYEQAIRDQFPVGGDFVEFFEAMGKVLNTLAVVQSLIDSEEDDRSVVDFTVGDRVHLVDHDTYPLSGGFVDKEGTITVVLPNSYFVVKTSAAEQQPLASALGYGAGMAVVQINNFKANNHG